MSTAIGQRLQQARQAKNLTVEQVARATHLRPHHIRAMEEGRMEALPSPVQARAFLRIYAEYLGLSFEALIAPPTKGEDNQTLTVAAASQPANPAVQEEISQAEKSIAPITPRQRTRTLTPKQASSPQETPIPLQVEEETKPEEETAAQNARAIFCSIGESLRQQRQITSLTLEDIAKQIHLRPQVLRALEDGNFDALPSPVQARGMLSTYANFLGLDAEVLLLRFAEGLQQQRQERLTAAPIHRTARPISRRLPAFITGDLLGGAFLTFILIGVVIWGAGRVSQLSQSAASTATLPSVSEILLNTPIAAEGDSAIPTSETKQSPAEGEEANSTPLATVAVEGKVQVVIVVLQRVWARVTVDGRVVQEGRLLPGQVYPFGGQERIEVLAGNGAAIQILYNQQDLGVIGSVGEVVDLIFTASGIQTPTPTVTPTPTASPSPTITPRPSPTPRPSATPRP